MAILVVTGSMDDKHGRHVGGAGVITIMLSPGRHVLCLTRRVGTTATRSMADFNCAAMKITLLDDLLACVSHPEQLA